MEPTLAGRRIVLGVTGGISAYKAVEVCRRLVDLGAHVVPVLTPSATRFVGETTFSALASEPVQTSMWDEKSPIPHTVLGQSADLVLVCPATARLIGSYAAGISNDLLTSTLLATVAPVIVCPAMHTEMWEHPAVQQNLVTLRGRGVHVVDPEDGHLAGGDSGKGRLASPEAIVAEVQRLFIPADLTDMSLLVTAGGTKEAIDPVRFLGNRSTGRQGHAIAEAAAARGATVVLVTTSDLDCGDRIDRIQVETAEQMFVAVNERAKSCEVVVMAAAVADFRPLNVSSEKIKKDSSEQIEIVFERTRDILGHLGEQKVSGQVLVGFAAETQDLLVNAASKLVAKNLDLIVANDVSAPGVGFAHETNSVTILSSDGSTVSVDLTSKRQVADLVLDAVLKCKNGS